MKQSQQQHDPKALVRRFVDIGVNQGQFHIVDEVLHPDFQLPMPSANSSATIKSWIATYRNAVPDAYWTIEQQVAENDTVVTCFTASGTHQGPCFGLAPTGRRMALHGVLFSRCVNNKIVAQWAQVDLLELLQQLGVMPPLALDKAVAVARLWHDHIRWTLPNQSHLDEAS